MPDKSPSNRSRRQILRDTAVVGGVGSTIPMAGCLGGEDVPDGDPVETLEILAFAEGVDGRRFQWALQARDEMESVGFDVEINAPDASTVVESMWAQPMESHFHTARYFDILDPGTNLDQYYHSSRIDSGNNISQYQDDHMDQLLEEQAEIVDVDERIEKIHEIQDYFVEEMVAVPMWYQLRDQPYRTDNVQNLTPQTENGIGNVLNFLNIEPVGDHDVLRFTYAEALDNLNPLDQVGRARREAQRLIYDRLVRILPPDDEVVPWAAEEIETHEDGEWVRFHLREDMYFHDGEPVTADDVVFSYEFYPEHSGEFAGRLGDVEDVEAEDELTVRFDMSEPTIGPTMAAGWGRAMILPEHIWSDLPDDVSNPREWSNPEAVGSGPFQVDDWEVGEQLSMSAHDEHWTEPNFDQVVRVAIDEERPAIRAIEDDSIDMITSAVPFDDYQRFQDIDELETIESPMSSTHQLLFNHDMQLFSDSRVRWAFAHMMNKEEMVQTVYGGRAGVIHSPVSGGQEIWYNDDVQEQTYDLDRSRELLEDVGFEWDDDGDIYYPEDW